MATTDASTSDLDTVPGRHHDLAACDLLPETHLVDAGYVSVGQILAAADDHGVTLIGPQAAGHQLAGRRRHRVRPDPVRHRLGRSPRRLPQAKTSRNWQPAPSRDGLPVIRPPSGSRTAAPAPTGHDAPAHKTTPGP